MDNFHNIVYDRVDTSLVIKFYREFFIIPLFDYTKINYD